MSFQDEVKRAMAETLAAVVQEVEENEDFRVQVNSSCIVSE